MSEQLLKVGEDSNISSTHSISNGNGNGVQNIENEVIETDKDTEKEDLLANGSLYPYDVMDKDLDIREDSMSVFKLMQKKERGELIIPEFQRNDDVWKPKQKSQFIESIILSFPIPPFHFNKTIAEGKVKYAIIDGLQRTTTLHSFMNNNFPLEGLNAIPKYNNMFFDDLPQHIRTSIEDKKLNIHVIEPSVPTEVVYDIFNRINTGGTQLSRQEVRNCIFIGKSTRLLTELSKKDYFRKAINEGIAPTRRKDQEAILRYLAFKIQGYESYSGNMSLFLEQAMRQINLMNNDEVNALKIDFERVMKKTTDFFGKENFRLIHKKGPRINLAVMESISHFFSNKDDVFLDKNQFKIIHNYRFLCGLKQYVEATTISTGSKQHVFTRFGKADEVLSKID